MTREEAAVAFVERFQAAAGLAVDGWAGARTLAALGALVGPLPPIPVPDLPGFRGDLAWLHQWEAHKGHPYWPGKGASGVTLDPGFDLGHQTEAALRRHYGFLGAQALDVLTDVIGLRGAAAGKAARGPEVKAIRISKAQATAALPAIAAPYWKDITKRFPALLEESTPGQVHTAALSLAYNRGPFNPELTPLVGPIALADWPEVADTIAGMQADHHLAGIPRRRKAEAALIREALA